MAVLIGLYVMMTGKKGATDADESSWPAPPGSSSRQLAAVYSYNNCLFDAVLASEAHITRSTALTSAELRAACDEFLAESGMPVVKPNDIAGEQYLNAISHIFDQPIHIIKGKDEWWISDHLEHAANAPICITHQGKPDAGHWVATRGCAADRKAGRPHIAFGEKS